MAENSGWQSAVAVEATQGQLEEPRPIVKKQTATPVQNLNAPSRHYVQGYQPAQNPLPHQTLQNGLISNFLPLDQQAAQANRQRQLQMKQFQQEQAQYRQEQLRRQQIRLQQQLMNQQQLKASQQLQARQLSSQKQAAYQSSIRTNSVRQQTNSQIPQQLGSVPRTPNLVSGRSYQRNVGTAAWYDPLGLLLHSIDSTSLYPEQGNTVRNRTERSSVLNATDHDGVVAAAVANASRRLNLQQGNLPQDNVRQANVQPADYRHVSNKPTSEIRQVSHDGNNSKIVNVASVGTTAKTSSDLHKPWNVEEFMRKQNSTGNPYRLVSDVQTETAKASPPRSDFGRAPVSSASKSAQTRTTVQKERTSIFSLGKHLANEFRPSNDRKWSQNHAVLQTAEFNGNLVTIRNVRYSKYQPSGDYTTIYYDATFNLNDVKTIDLVIVPFHALPSLAHVQASFGFADGRHIALSIEARYEEGEQYDPVAASMRQFELIYVLADERDLIRIGTDVNNNDVHIYRLKFEPSEVREMFVDAVNRANTLAKKPEFYHPLRNSCVTNLMNHINKGRPRAIPKEYRTLLPGLMDQYVYDLNLVDTTASTFKEARENAKVNWLVEKYGDLEYFSAGIRQNMY